MASWWEELWALMFPETADPKTQIGQSAAAARARGEVYEGPLGSVGVLPASLVENYKSYEKSPAVNLASATPVASTTALAAPGPSTTRATPAGEAPTGGSSDDDASSRALEQAKLGGGGGAIGDLYGNLPAGTVYLGKYGKPSGHPTQRIAPTSGHPTQRTGSVPPQIEQTAGIRDVIAQVNDWSPKKVERFRELAVKADFKDPGPNLENIERIWAGLVVRSAKMYEKGIKITPWQLLNRYATQGGSGGGAGSAPRTVTSTSTVVDLTEPKTARALVDQVLTERLGRAATEKERKAFLAALNSYERKNPKSTTTTTTTSASGESVTSSSTSKGGVNPSAFAQDWALQHNEDEAREYQALAYFMPAFFSALSAPV